GPCEPIIDTATHGLGAHATPHFAPPRSKMNRQSIWTSLGLLLLLAIAVATIWGFAAGYLLSTWEANTRSGVNEHLAIRVDGMPMIDSSTYAGGVYQQLPQRSLDGKELPGPHHSQMDGATIDVRRRPTSW